MSFIQETLKCPCGKYMNIALGTFGFGYPEECPFCKKHEKFERVGSGWLADEYGDLKPDYLAGI